MQTNRNVYPVNRLHQCQEEKVPSTPFLMHSCIPATTGTSIWIDSVAQRGIVLSLFTFEENHYASPPAEVDIVAHDTVTPASSPVPLKRAASENGQPHGTGEEDALALRLTTRRIHLPLVQSMWAGCVRAMLTHWSSALKLLERLRWSLLIPGRLEILFWLGGAILLMSSICVFLFVTPVSIVWIGAYGPTALSAAHQNVVACPNVHPSSLLTQLLLFVLHG